MKTTILSIAAMCALAACATGPSAYCPSAGQNGLGFDVSKIESDRFRVNYTARNAAEAQDFALLRAAEITLAEGYSHFRVIGGDTFADAPRRSGVSTSVGFGTGRGYYGRGSSVGVGLNINDVARALNGPKVSHMIEVKLLREGSDNPDTFDAQSVAENIRPQVFSD